VIGLIRSEFRKITTTRLWWGLLLGVVLSSLGLAVLLAILSEIATPGQPAPLGVRDPQVVRGVYTAGLSISYLLALTLGIVAMAGEYRQRTMTATVLAAPRRSRIVLAKLVVLSAVGLGFGVAGALAGVVGGAAVIAAKGADPRLASDGIPRALALSVLAVALWAVVGLGVGTLIRNQVVALMVSIGVAQVGEPLVAFGLDAAGWGAAARFFPSRATSALIEPATQSGAVSVSVLPWWGGALVLLGYAVVAGALGTLLTLRRDIT
jgi:ABC-2 type transport system permease protein